MADPHPLDVEQVSICYGDFFAVRDVSFQVREGEIFGLLGPNGAGKTSLISTMVTLLAPTEGSVRVFGYNVGTQAREAKFRTGCVPQEIVHHGFFTVDEILTNYSGYYGMRNNREHMEYLLDRLGLVPHRHKQVKQLSGGIKRRLMIAKALLHRPRLLLLDEPTAGVDIELRESLWVFVKELRSSGVSVLLTTHYLEEAEELCDRIGILDHGRIEEIADTKDLVNRYSTRRVIVSLHERIQRPRHEAIVSATDTMIEMQLATNQDLGQVLVELGLELTNIRDVQTREGSLQEAFQTILGRKGAQK